jgi:Mce-associated membrane protein
MAGVEREVRAVSGGDQMSDVNTSETSAAGDDLAVPPTTADNTVDDNTGTPARQRGRLLEALSPRTLSRRAGRVRTGWRVAWTVVLVILVAGVGTGCWLLHGSVAGTQDSQSDSAAAAAAAKTETQQLLSWNYKNLTPGTAQGLADTTGEFAGEWKTLVSQYIAPGVKGEDTVTVAKVSDVAPISVNGNEVSVLVFLDQSTTDKKDTKAQVAESQLQLTMEKVGGKWLIERFQAL